MYFCNGSKVKEEVSSRNQKEGSVNFWGRGGEGAREGSSAGGKDVCKRRPRGEGLRGGDLNRVKASGEG